MSGAYLTNTGGASFRNDQGGAGRDYKRAQSDYGRAMRLLRRSKDPNDALKMIDLRDNARERGIEIGGIRSAEDNARNAQAYTSNLERMAGEREREAQMNQGMAGRVGALENAMADPQERGMVKKDISGRIITPMQKRGDDLPRSNAGGQNPKGVLDAPLAPKKDTSRLSFAEQEKRKREELTRSGAFGSGAQRRLSQGRRF